MELDNECYDTHLQHFLQKKIAELPMNEQLVLKNIKLCNKRITPNIDGIYILRNSNHHTRFFGQCTCKNSFVCPVCSARIMKRHRTDIGVALDTLHEQGYHALMITLAIPHLAFQSCKEVQDILYKSLRYAFTNKNTRRPGKWCSPINKFWVECDIEYYVRVSEFTYGKNGFNPHFHMLVWTKQNVENLLPYQEEVEKYWIKRVKQFTKQWQMQNGCYDEKRFNAIFAFEDAGYSVKFSDHEAFSSEYLTGWGSNSELTGNVQKKASHSGHYTPYQILTMAEHNEKYWEVYRQFAVNVCRKPVHRRVEYSKGLKQIIAQAKNTEGYTEIVRKKKEVADWVIVGWLSKNAWYEICELNKSFPIMANILYLAKENEHILEEYLAFYGITISKTQTFYGKQVQELFAA